jgi:D-3-phosphoglycerate dehydrogenase
VKELVLAGMLLAARNVCAAWDFVRGLDGDDHELNSAVELGKKQFVGFELPGRTLGVIGLGAIGVQVANVALGLGMRVIGFDPEITVTRAWQLSSHVQQAASVGDLLAHSDVVSLHVPLAEATRGLLDARRIALMRDGATLLNFSRDGIADEEALLGALEAGKLHAYVCDFPTAALKAHPRTIALPHIGASTREAEDNCAVMVADQLRAFLEDGNIENSVNFPQVQMPRNGGFRIAVVNANVPNMLGQISTALAQANLNIIDMLNKSRGDLAYTLTDVEASPSADVIGELAGIEGVMSVRTL